MDSHDRPEPNVPAVPVRISASRPAIFEPTQNGRSSAAEPPRSVNVVRAALRAVSRHWWQILLLWGIGTGGLCYVIMSQVKPKYHSFSTLRIEPSHKDIYGTGMYSTESLIHLMQTQVHLIRSPSVLSAALTDPKISSLPSFAKVKTTDAQAELSRLLEVSVIPDSYLIQIGWTSENAAECPRIVNEVVDAYLSHSAEWTEGATKGQIKRLEEHESELIAMANQKEEQLLELTRKNGGIDIEFDNSKDDGRGQAIPVRNKLTIDEFKRRNDELFEINLELEKLKSVLEAREDAIAERGHDDRLDQKAAQKIQAMPDVAKMVAEMDKLRLDYNRKKPLVRNPDDPSLTSIQKRYNDLKAQYDQLYKDRYDAVLADLQNEGADEAGRSVRDMRDQVEMLTAKQTVLKKAIKEIEVTNRNSGTDAVKAALANQALTSYNSMREAVRKLLQQLRFEQKGEARISRVDPAQENQIPVSNNRQKFLAATPVGVMAVVLALFVMLELKIGRVSDLEDLSKQMPVEVFALPPLPGPRLEPGQRGARERESRLQEFLQSLDHLRVALYEEHPAGAGAGGRCFVITSATAAEGKTTLSAQLSACCAKAGVSVLLIDADMRRATLSRMLNEEKSHGLSDVLQGEISPEEAAVPIPDAGFSLLPAGSTGRDPSWLLKGQKIGQLMARYRQMFDLVIIDTPPILPVPDALTIGRWSDGAVLTTRFDVSRFPMVDRARRRLVSAGIPLLTTVVNGVRTSRFYYGYSGYGYGYGYGGYGSYGGYGDRDRAVSPPPETTTSA